MDFTWSSPWEDTDASPPWVQHSRLQTQQELCAKRFLRFASLHQVHGAFAIWAAALFFAGIHPVLASAPVAYFTGLVALTRRQLTCCGLEHLSIFILLLNVLNAVHLAALCVLQGDRVLASPLFAFVPLSRVLFGLFTQEVHCHLGLSTILTVLVVGCNSKRVAGGEALLVVIALLLLELIAVIVLAEGPCGYEEAVMHLAQCRAQHQLARSQAVQRIDVEREEFSGRLLAIAMQSTAELTAAVQRASEPVLDMLKSSCATGTKSAHEAERIGRIGESLKEEVAEILRHKTQVAWTRLQDHAKERTTQLRRNGKIQQATSESMLDFFHQRMGKSLAQMHELELEAEASLEQLIVSEVKRARETADARMDLVRQSAQAMERRVSDTVEVLLSLLKYFRSKGSPNVVVVSAGTPSRERTTKSITGGVGPSRRNAEADNRRSLARQLPAICESRGQAAETSGVLDGESNNQQTGQGQAGEKADGSGAFIKDSGTDNSMRICYLDGSHPSATAASTMAEVASTSSGGAELAADATAALGGEVGSTSTGPLSSTSAEASEEATSDAGSECSSSTRTSGTRTEQFLRRGSSIGTSVTNNPSIARSAIERHPLFASRLCYQSDEFFWSWASSRDFRAEADALRQWQRAAPCNPAPGYPSRKSAAGSTAGIAGSRSEDGTASVVRSESSLQWQPGPTHVYIDLAAVKLPEPKPAFV